MLLITAHSPAVRRGDCGLAGASVGDSERVFLRASSWPGAGELCLRHEWLRGPGGGLPVAAAFELVPDLLTEGPVTPKLRDLADVGIDVVLLGHDHARR